MSFSPHFYLVNLCCVSGYFHLITLIQLLKLYVLISLPPFLIVYLYYIIKVQNPEKCSQNRIYELLWIVNDEYKLLN